MSVYHVSDPLFSICLYLHQIPLCIQYSLRIWNYCDNGDTGIVYLTSVNELLRLKWTAEFGG